MGLWWAYVGSLGGSAGPMFGLCWAKRCRHLGLCSANFNPDLRKIRSGLRKPSFLGHAPAILGLSCAKWGHVGPILQQLAHPLLELHVAILHCIKLNLTWRIFWLKMRLSSNMQIYQWTIFVWMGNNKGWKHKTIYIIFIYISVYLSRSICLYLYISMCCNNGNG